MDPGGSYGLPIYSPLIQTHMGSGALKDFETPGDLVSFIPFTYFERYLLRIHISETLLVPGRPGDQGQ